MTTSSAQTEASRRPTVLFVCTHNAGRSQLAAGLAEYRAKDAVRVLSAGTEPDPVISPEVVASLAELGIDRSDRVPQPVTAEMVESADVVVSLRPGLPIPLAPGARHEVWPLPDPAGWTVDSIRPLRDHLQVRVDRLVSDLLAPEQPR